MKHEETLFARYLDLLDEPSDAETQAIIEQLDVVYTTPAPPTRLTLAAALELNAGAGERERAARQKPGVRLARWVLAPRPLPQRLVGVAIALLLALVLTVGSSYAVGTILDRVLHFEPGTEQIELKNLYQNINQSQTIQGFTLTAAQGYADSNRVIVTFTVKKPAGHVYNHASPEGVTLTTQGGLALPFYSGNGYGGGKGSEDAYADFFDAAGVVGNPHELQLRMEVPLLDIAQQDGGDSTLRTYQIPGPVSFDFSLAFHPGRIATVQQTVTNSAGSLTLERVVVTLSETRVYLHMQGLGSGPLFPARLAVDGWDSTQEPLGPIGPVGGRDAASSDQTTFFISVSLYDKHGEWTLVMGQPGGETWTFHFVVP